MDCRYVEDGKDSVRDEILMCDGNEKVQGFSPEAMLAALSLSTFYANSVVTSAWSLRSNKNGARSFSADPLYRT